MTQSANRKETWWEIAAVPTFPPRNFFTPEEISVSIHPITIDDSLLHYRFVSDLTIETDLFFSSAFDLSDEPIRYVEIAQSDIPLDEPYVLKKNIPAVVERESETDFIATFRAGNVSIAAETFRDAVQWLVLEILDTFDALTDCESNLGPDAERQFHILSDYIAKADGTTR
jgi:hypothetical protein